MRTLLSLSWVIVLLRYVFSLRRVEKVLSAVAVVTGIVNLYSRRRFSTSEKGVIFVVVDMTCVVARSMCVHSSCFSRF